MRSSYITDTGKVRDHNEDSVTVIKVKNGDYLLVVADGMGGHRKGEVASMICIKYLIKAASDLESFGDKLNAVKWLNDNITKVNEEIFSYSKNHEDSYGMGTTIVASIVSKDYLLFANIGDSSGYVFKGGKLHKVTKDHTLVNLLVDSGSITNEEAKHHPKKNVLMKALGVSEITELDIFGVDGGFDAILLCSDGLTGMLSDDLIENVLNENLGVEKKVSKLVTKANARGGNDNISIALLLNEGEVIN